MKTPKRLRRALRSPARHTILTPGRNCWRVAPVEDSGLLIDGRDYYRAFYHAARTAERSILISGWQFDSAVELLRDADAQEAQGSVGLLAFLNELCEQKPELRVHILTWDHSMLYSLDREWFQDWNVNRTTNERLKFCLDSCKSYDASHHQKFVVIDSTIAFVGGLDLCASRWDDRDHRTDNPLRRNSKGDSYKTFHDMQAYYTGPLVKDLAEYFKKRWKIVCCEDLTAETSSNARPLPFKPSLSIGPARLALCRTETACAKGGKSALEIRQLFIDAIDAAERLIYIENQYCSSQALADALIERMRQRRRPRLQIVFVIAKDAEAFLERLSIGIAQSRNIRRLKEVAAQTGHSFGIYYPVSMAADGAEVPTYIHSKLLLVDDRFLSIGSANMNNRSMGYDTELNVAWDDLPGSPLSHSIRSARVSLLAEHTGLDAGYAELAATEGLVDFLNGLANGGKTRLRHHPARSVAEENHWLTNFLPDGLPFDLEIALESDETNTRNDSLLAKSLAALGRIFHGWFAGTEKIERLGDRETRLVR